ncbi:MAG: ABC transporter permease subunit [Oscillospiraceae bacterium]|nr:ABC transporter permease subunit [Oscillospiraceae bacterium]
MRNLLAADFARLRRNKSLWLICILYGLFSLVLSISGSASAAQMAARGYVVYAEEYFYAAVPGLGVLLGVFTSIFLGTEYSDGTLRNKLIAGRSRAAVYLSGFAASFAAGLLLLIFWLLGASASLFLSDLPFENGYGEVVLAILALVGSMAAFAAVYALIGRLSSGKTRALIISLAVFFVFMLVASGLYDRLSEVEFTGGMMMDGRQFIEVPRAPNPLHLSGRARTYCEIAMEAVPFGLHAMLNNSEPIHPLRQLVIFLVLTLLVNLVGVGIFKKKDIK